MTFGDVNHPATHSTMFSIVVINFNYARFLRDSIDSALAQTYPEFEVIVVDDASTDESRAVIDSYGDRIIKVLKEVNRGHGDGFNQGFAASRGDIVLFLDADDFLYPDCLAALAAEVQPEVAQFQWRMDLVDEARVRVDTYPAPSETLDGGDVRPKLARCGRYGTSVTSGLGFSRAALERVLPMDAEAFRQGGDGYLVTVVPLYGTVRTVEGVLSAYRIHGANHSQFGAAIARRARWRLEHDEARIHALCEHADKTGLVLGSDLLLSDLSHLTERMASLRIDPQNHPYKSDRRVSLALRGCSLTLRSDAGALRKTLILFWWMTVGVAPGFVARRLIVWRLFAPSRPDWLRRSAKRLRVLLEGRS